MKQPAVPLLVELLEKEYGRRELVPNRQPLAELVQTILSQNTSDVNSRPAFKALLERYDSWPKVLAADKSELAATIRAGGLGLIKARRICSALREIGRQRGSLDLAFLEEMPVPQAREWLKRLPGVGNKTANCVLLFALGKPALPVDTHIYRLSKRLWLVPSTASLDEAHNLLEKKVPPEMIYNFHVLMIEHGRRACRAQSPRCPACALGTVCPSRPDFDLKPAESKKKAIGRK